jgi:hypothetical protein
MTGDLKQAETADSGLEEVLIEASRLYERYVLLAEIGRTLSPSETDLWESAWQSAEIEERALGLVIEEAALI